MSLIPSLPRAEPPPLLRGDDVFLRYPHAADFEEWSALRGASRAFLTPWEPTWGTNDLTRASYRQRLRRYQRDVRDDKGYAFFIFDAGTGALAGGATLSNVRRGVSQACSLGYWMGEAYAGRGMMRRALTALLPHIFGKLALHRIEAACLLDNERSQRLLRSLGFVEEGVARQYLRINGAWRDHVLFALLAADKQPR